MRKAAILLLIAMLAACGGGDGDKAGRELRGETSAPEAKPETREPAEIGNLTGLYEAAANGGRRAQMCMESKPGGGASFGIVSETPEGAGCGGAGEAVREGDLLRLTMAGDEQCTIEARISGREVRFPATLAAGCDYYCGPGTSLAGSVLAKTGDTKADAMRAADLAGDPLCA